MRSSSELELCAESELTRRFDGLQATRPMQTGAECRVDAGDGVRIEDVEEVGHYLEAIAAGPEDLRETHVEDVPQREELRPWLHQGNGLRRTGGQWTPQPRNDDGVRRSPAGQRLRTGQRPICAGYLHVVRQQIRSIQLDIRSI